MTRILSLLLILSAGSAGYASASTSAETFVGQVRVQTRAEGVVIALDIEGDGIIDHVFIADRLKIAAAWAGPATVNVSETYIQVVPTDGSPGLQYHVGKEGPTWPTKHGYRGQSVLGLIHYSGQVVAAPLAELDSWAIPGTDVEDDRPTKRSNLAALPWFNENRGPYVGTTRIVPREGGAVIAVDDSKRSDGIADVVLVVQAREPIEAWTGHALVEVTDAGVRIVDLDRKFRVVLSILPTKIQTRRDAIPLADLDKVEQP
jgi:hypothetical protein